MAEKTSSLDADIQTFARWLAAPDLGRSEWREELDFLSTDDDAREYLEGIKLSLEDLREGRVVPHAQVVRDIEERHRRYSADAAE